MAYHRRTYSIGEPSGVCIITFGRISSKIPDFYPIIPKPFTPSFTPSLDPCRNEGVRSADCPVFLGLSEDRRRKSKVLLHSGLPHQLPRQSQLTTLTAVPALQSLVFHEKSYPRQYPETGLFSPLRHSRYIGHNVARVFGGFTSLGLAKIPPPQEYTKLVYSTIDYTVVVCLCRRSTCHGTKN